MQVSIVVAAAENGTIGADGGIPWRLPDDQRHFKRLTVGHCIVMGRRTHESIGRLLPDRTTIVVSRNAALTIDGARVAGSLEDALALAGELGETEAFVVGGAGLYTLALPHASRIHLTRVHAEIPGDTRFPTDAELAQAGFARRSSERHDADERHAHPFSFEVWERDASAP